MPKNTAKGPGRHEDSNAYPPIAKQEPSKTYEVPDFGLQKQERQTNKKPDR